MYLKKILEYQSVDQCIFIKFLYLEINDYFFEPDPKFQLFFQQLCKKSLCQSNSNRNFSLYQLTYSLKD